MNNATDVPGVAPEVKQPPPTLELPPTAQPEPPADIWTWHCPGKAPR